MTSLSSRIAALQAVWFPAGGPGPLTPGCSQDEAAALGRGVARKARFAQMHLAILTGVNWSELDNIGQPAGSGTVLELHIQLPQASLTFSHHTAAINQVYLSFDGLTAALVNMTDTLGRMLNKIYSLGIDPRGATLFAVNQCCVPTSALGTILSDASQMDWLRRVRDLRGRCQHADIEEVLLTATGPLSVRKPPIVDTPYSWAASPGQTSITDYAQQACAACETCMIAIMDAVLGNPASPTT